MPRIKQHVVESMQEKYDNVNLFKDPHVLQSLQGKWSSQAFGNDNPICIEVGMGNGAFLTQMIEYYENQEISYNYIGLEIKEFRVWKSMRKNKQFIEAGILKLINARAEKLTDMFAQHEISKIHLNFSDPWPKDRHAKHRLTSPIFLEIYSNILTSQGELIIKTDNDNLYAYSLETLPVGGFEIVAHTDDVHDTEVIEKNFVTEFEEKWLRKGMKIKYIKAFRK